MVLWTLVHLLRLLVFQIKSLFLAPTVQLLIYWPVIQWEGLPRWCSGKESACQCRRPGDAGLFPGLGRYPGVGNGNPLQYSCLENPIDRGAWWATRSCKESDITERLTLSLSIILVNTHSIAYLPNPIWSACHILTHFVLKRKKIIFPLFLS